MKRLIKQPMVPPIKNWPADRVERKSIASLIPYANNARTHSDAQIAQVARSIEQYGFTVPVLIDDTGGIIAGHCRVLAAKQLGLAEVPVMTATGWSEAERRAYIIIDNKLALNAEWNDAALRVEFAELEAVGFDLSNLGFDPLELKAIRHGGTTGLTDPDEAPSAPQEPVCAPGEVWLLGSHRLVCGDVFDALTVIDGVDAILTDPPYGMDLDTDFSKIKGSLNSIGRQNKTKGNRYDPVIGDDREFNPSPIMERFSDVVEQFWFGADYYIDCVANHRNGSWLVWDKRKETQSEAVGAEFELCWSHNKHKRRMLRHDWFGFLSSKNGSDARNRVHPTQKPVTLFNDIIEQWVKPRGRVFDPFVGSGTTIIAAEMTGRICHAIEISPAYCDVTIQRWQNFTGRKAQRDDGKSFEWNGMWRKPFDRPELVHGPESL